VVERVRVDVPNTVDGALGETRRRRPVSVLVGAWGVFGVALLLGRAAARLAVYAVEPIREHSLTPLQMAIYGTWATIGLYFEGYRAFQKRFCPRVAARALHLGEHRNALHVALAPLFCMGFFHANRRTKALAWGTTMMIVCFIAVLRHVPQPWRGIVDGGVVPPLVWGAVAVIVLYVRGLAGADIGSAELPGDVGLRDA
jgi:hypothetical protein